MKNKKISIKNYLLLGLIMLTTVFLTLYLAHSYKQSKMNTKINTTMSNFLINMNIPELQNYVIENPNFVIYLFNDDKDEYKEFEEKLKNEIINYGIKDDFIYINIYNNSNKDLNLLKSMFDDKISNKDFNVNNKINLLYVNNGKINSILYYDIHDISIENVKAFLKMVGVIV